VGKLKLNKIMEKGFVKNEDLLKETHKVDDCLGFESLIENFSKKVFNIDKPSIFGLVGPFGSGKSTMLFQMQKKMEDSAKWINFDAWKYPDRQDLWEGFVLDFAKSISPDEFKNVDKKIKGKQNDDKKTLIKVLSRIPGFAVLDGLNHFFETSPARRVDEIQGILTDQIKKSNEDLFVVVEDIDRSGDSGVFFLETLKQFISNLKTNNKIIVIVPMSDVSYYEKFDSYLKSVDYFDFFQPAELKLDKFVDEIFDNTLFEGQLKRKDNNRIIWTGEARRAQTISFLQGLFKEHKEMSMRLLKLIIRKANLVYINQMEDGHEPDFRVTLCFEVAKYFNVSGNDDKKYFDNFKQRGVVIRGNIFSSFLFAMLANRDNLYEEDRAGRNSIKRLLSSPHDFKFIERKEVDQREPGESLPSEPWEYNDMFSEVPGKKYAITKFYLDY
jgi:hypothetical protein